MTLLPTTHLQAFSLDAPASPYYPCSKKSDALVPKLQLGNTPLPAKLRLATSATMRSRYRIIENHTPYFITCTIVAWVPVFTQKPYFDLIIDSLTFCRLHKGLQLFSYVILDNHLHLLAAGDSLSAIMQDFKSYTAKSINRQAQLDNRQWLLKIFQQSKPAHKHDSQFQVWMEGFHPQLITSPDMLEQKISYIHHNPVARGLVARPEDWLYSSASNFLSAQGAMTIDPLII